MGLLCSAEVECLVKGFASATPCAISVRFTELLNGNERKSGAAGHSMNTSRARRRGCRGEVGGEK